MPEQSADPRRVRHTTAALLAVVATVSIAALGCGTSRKPATSRIASEPPAATAGGAAHPSGLLVGTYARRVTRSDIARAAAFRHDAGPYQQAPVPGPARLIIAGSRITYIAPQAKPQLQIDENATATIGGGLTINGYINPDQGSFCGPEIPQNATYTWSIHGEVLTLKAVRDRCAGRDSTLTGTWRRT
jgi:hypothetical protein